MRETFVLVNACVLMFGYTIHYVMLCYVMMLNEKPLHPTNFMGKFNTCSMCVSASHNIFEQFCPAHVLYGRVFISLCECVHRKSQLKFK